MKSLPQRDVAGSTCGHSNDTHGEARVKAWMAASCGPLHEISSCCSDPLVPAMCFLCLHTLHFDMNSWGARVILPFRRRFACTMR